MKKLLFLFVMVLFMPIVVSAYNVYVNMYFYAGNVYFKGNVLEASTSYNNHLYLDNRSIMEDMTQQGNSLLYTLSNDVIVKSVDYDYNNGTRELTIYFESLSSTKVHCFIDGKDPDEITNPYYYFDKKYCDDYLEEGHYYSSNDILLVYSNASSKNFYDKNGEAVSFSSSQSAFFPKMNDNLTYWVYTGTENNGYDYYISPVFEEYVPPKFEFSCTPKTIKYGEKSVCTLYATSDFDLKSVNFDLDSKEYKVLSAKFSDGINNKEGQKQYNLEITNDFSQDGDKLVLGVFEITGAKNQEYSNQVQIINLDFVDTKAAAKYANLEDPVEIIALAESKEENPVTSSMSIIIPIILFVIAGTVYFIVDKKKKEITC